MKIRSVGFSLRKRAFVIDSDSGELELPFAGLKVKPTASNRISSVSRDSETGFQSFTYELADGSTDTVLLEEVLHINRDPEILRQHLLYSLTLDAQSALKHSKVSKRLLARRLQIQPAQLYRLLDQTFYGKTIDQMIKLLSGLGQEVTIKVRRAA